MRLFATVILLALPLAGQDTAADQQSAPAAERTISGTLDVGYRFVSDAGGDLNTYRSVVNLGEGPKLIGLDFFAEDPSNKYVERLMVNANSWGGDPYNTARVEAEKSGFYRFLFDYRNIAYFNYLPSFANPGIGQGTLLNQRSYDTRRRYANAELEFRPGKAIVPYVSYSRDSGRGRGITPFVSNGNEYPLWTNLNDKTDNFRGGVRIDQSSWHLTLEQGGTSFKDDQHVFTTEPNSGNRATPIFGRQLALDDLSQSYRVRGTSIYSRAVMTASPVSWANVQGQFLFSQPRSDVDYNDTAEGLLYMGATRFFAAQQSLYSGEAKQPHTSGSFTAEIRPIQRLRIVESWYTDRLHNAAASVLDFATLPIEQVDGQSLFTDRLVANYSRQQLDAFFDVTRHITVRGGHRYEWGDSVVRSPSLSFGGPVETAQLRRNVGLAGLNFHAARKLSVNLDYEGSVGDQSYFRTSLHDFNKLRLRGRYELTSALQFGANFMLLNNENPSAGTDYEFRSIVGSASLRWLPQGGKRFSVLGEYTWAGLKSDISFTDPGTFGIARSLYRENSHSAVALVDIVLPSLGGSAAPRINVGGSLFRSSGSRPTNYYQPVGRFSLPLHHHVTCYAEWRWYGMSQVFYSFEGFRTHHFLTGLRLTL